MEKYEEVDEEEERPVVSVCVWQTKRHFSAPIFMVKTWKPKRVAMNNLHFSVQRFYKHDMFIFLMLA